MATLTKRVFNKEIENIEGRKIYVADILGQIDNIDEMVARELEKGSNLENTKIGGYLDRVANYLLESKDIESGRKINDTFYLSEKDYRSHYSMGRNCYPSSEDVLDFYEKGAAEEQMQNNLNREYVDRLFNFSNLTESDMRRFITSGCNYPDDISEHLRQSIEWLYDELFRIASKGEKEIMALFQEGKNIKEIALIKGVTERSVRKSLKNICRKGAEKVPFFCLALHYK